jgi:hypothetical protein
MCTTIAGTNTPRGPVRAELHTCTQTLIHTYIHVHHNCRCEYSPRTHPSRQYGCCTNKQSATRSICLHESYTRVGRRLRCVSDVCKHLRSPFALRFRRLQTPPVAVCAAFQTFAKDFICLYKIPCALVAVYNAFQRLQTPPCLDGGQKRNWCVHALKIYIHTYVRTVFGQRQRKELLCGYLEKYSYTRTSATIFHTCC